jgi:1-acyl-sn-glycerol-3-phosphate acyltransferase
MAERWLRLTGWRVATPPPTDRKFVLLAAPFTSTWDVVHMLAVFWSWEREIAFLADEALLRGSLGRIVRAAGGVSSLDSAEEDLVQHMTRRFAQSDDLVLAVSPEGTRQRADRWSSTFYELACAADVRVGMGYVDHARREAGVGFMLAPSGCPRLDMNRVRSFYADKAPRHPERFAVPRMRAEDLTMHLTPVPGSPGALPVVRPARLPAPSRLVPRARASSLR